MKFKDIFIGAGISIILVCFLFYKSIFYGAIPFPGDSLLSHFKPWQVTSYDGYGAGGIPNKSTIPRCNTTNVSLANRGYTPMERRKCSTLESL